MAIRLVGIDGRADIVWSGGERAYYPTASDRLSCAVGHVQLWKFSENDRAVIQDTSSLFDSESLVNEFKKALSASPGIRDDDWTNTWRLGAIGDFDVPPDGKPDLVFQNQGTEDVAIAFMNGTLTRSVTLVTPPPPLIPGRRYLRHPPQVIGAGDVNGDGKSDLVITDSGTVGFWYMSGPSVTGRSPVEIIPAGYVLRAVAKIEQDAKRDLVWHDVIYKNVVAWLMGTTSHREIVLGKANEELVSAADYDGNGFVDLLWRNAKTYEVHAWFGKGQIQVDKTFLYGPDKQPRSQDGSWFRPW